MNIIQLPADLIERNARLLSATPDRGASLDERLAAPLARDQQDAAVLSGVLRNGHLEVTASVPPGTSGNVHVTFEMMVPSISAQMFRRYRLALAGLWADPAMERRIARQAGIVPPPPPDPASRMARYALDLFADLVFDDAPIQDCDRRFDAKGASVGCRQMLSVMRRLDVSRLRAEGTLEASSQAPDTRYAVAYVPITAVLFDDGLTIPFAGYSANVSARYGIGDIAPVLAIAWHDAAAS